MITAKVLKALEFNKILQLAADSAQSEPGREYILNTLPSTGYEEAEKLQTLTQDAMLSITENKYNPSFRFDNISEILKKAEISANLTLAELLKTARHLNVSRTAKNTISIFNRQLLNEIIQYIVPVKSLEDKIAKTVMSDSEIYDSASDKLYNIRRKIRAANDGIRKKLSEYISSSSYSKFLQDNIVTIRSGRYVIPVKQEYKSSIPGLIHDRSASGATVFVEPMAIVEFNNELKTLLLEEEEETERIIAELSADTAAVKETLFVNNEQLILLDALYAKADFALAHNAYKPALNKRGKIKIIKGRHPLLGKKAVPLDVEINNKILLISGPNTGGKTVALKTIGLFSVMSMSGFFIPAAEAEFSVFESVYCDIGDEQSIENALSTFSSHMTNIINITDNADFSSLILLDEIGAGTDPAEGAALAIGIVKYLIDIKCTAVITTHFYELKEFSINNPGISNASMQFDPQTFRPTYKILNGLPGSSNALQISKFLGLNELIIKYAEENLSEEKKRFENTLKNAESAKVNAENELEKYKKLNYELETELNSIKKERESLKNINDSIRLNAKAETRRQIQKYIEEADGLITELKETLKEQDEKALLEARRLKTKLSDVLYNDNESEFELSELKVIKKEDAKSGSTVILKTHNLKGEIISVDLKRETAEIMSGNIMLSADIKDLCYVPVNNEKSGKKTVNNIERSINITEAPPMEIKLLGQTVMEAEYNLEDFILKAAARNVKIIKVVHGVGTGALKRGLHQYFKGNPLISEYRLGQYGEGGPGVTIITLK